MRLTVLNSTGTGSCPALYCLLLAAPALAQDYGTEARERLHDVKGWDEMCVIEDCTQFPDGYATYAFGPELYYFPNPSTFLERFPVYVPGGVRAGHFKEYNDEGEILRSFGPSIGLIISACCQHLLEFYDLAKDFPTFYLPRGGNRMPRTRVLIHAYNDPGTDNKISRHFRITYPKNEPPAIEDVILEDQQSYNDDFWLISVSEPNKSGESYFGVLSKRPLLNDRHVYAQCTSGCNFHTVSFEKDANNKRIHINLLWMTLAEENMFLCTAETLLQGCDPASDVFDQVPRMLELIEDMFTAAQTKPQNL